MYNVHINKKQHPKPGVANLFERVSYIRNLKFSAIDIKEFSVGKFIRSAKKKKDIII